MTPALGRAVVRGIKTTHRIPAGRQTRCAYETWAPPRVVEVDGDVYTGQERGVYALEYEQPLADAFGGTVNDRHGKARVTYATRTVLRVTDIGRERLEDITDDSAAAEGFSSFAAFLDYWTDQHGDLTDRRMAGDVWVIHFTTEHQDAVHLLPNLPHEPEAVDPELVADLPASRAAQQRWHRDRAASRATYSHLPTEELVALALRGMREYRIAGDNSFERLIRVKATDILERLDDRAA